MYKKSEWTNIIKANGSILLKLFNTLLGMNSKIKRRTGGNVQLSLNKRQQHIL